MNMVDEIVKYQELYSTDLAKRLQISDDDKKLPVALSMPALLNPMFGTREYIVGSDLMSERQYDMAEDKLLQRMTDILDRTNPLFAPNKEHNEEISNNQGTNGTDDTSSEEEVEEVNIINSNFQKAKQEWSNLKKWTSKQYRRKLIQTPARPPVLGITEQGRVSTLAQSWKERKTCQIRPEMARRRTWQTIWTNAGGWT